MDNYRVYPARVVQDGNFVVAEVRGMENAAWGQGSTAEEALEKARKSIPELAEVQFRRGYTVAPAKKPQKGDALIELSYDTALKIDLRNTMLFYGVTKSDLARRLKILPQTLETWLRFGKTTKLDSLAAAFAAIGETLEIGHAETR